MFSMKLTMRKQIAAERDSAGPAGLVFSKPSLNKRRNNAEKLFQIQFDKLVLNTCYWETVKVVAKGSELGVINRR